MAKIFGFSSFGNSGSSDLDLMEMKKSLNLDFKSQKLIEFDKTKVGIGVINDYDCQPVVLSEGSICLTLMGKIFNSREEEKKIFHNILQSVRIYDLEMLKEALRNINGLFIMFIHDSNKNRTFLINDRYGMEPLYYSLENNKLVFSSEIKAILVDKSFKRDINWNFWRDFFQYGFGIGNKTPFKNIFNMSNATVFSFKEGGLEAFKYWNYEEIQVNHDLGEKEAIDKGTKVLKDVFSRQSIGLDECAVFLSGGYDSRCISCALKYFTGVSFENYSTSLHPSGRIESSIAKKVSDRLGVRFNFVGKIKNMYKDYFNKHIKQIDGLCTEHMWILPLVDSLKKDFANFDGIGGDVLLKNVSATRQNIGQHKENDKIINILNKEMIAYWSGEMCQDIFKYFDQDISKRIQPNTDSLKDEIYGLGESENKVIIFYLLNRTRNVASLAARHLIAHKVYSYFPFFDNEFVEYSLSLPSEMKYYKNIYYRILEKIFPEIMEIPTTNDKTIRMRIQDALTRSLGWKNYAWILSIYKKFLLTIDPKIFSSEEMQFLRDLLNNIEMPAFIDRNSIIKKVNNDIRSRNNPMLFVTKILQFCIWFKEYFST